MAELLGRVERLSGTVGNQAQIAGQGQVNEKEYFSKKSI